MKERLFGLTNSESNHGEDGAWLGVSHQTGWTGTIARLMHLFGTLTPEAVLESGKMSYAKVQARTQQSASVAGSVHS